MSMKAFWEGADGVGSNHSLLAIPHSDPPDSEVSLFYRGKLRLQMMEGSPVKVLRIFPAMAVVLVLSLPNQSAAQAQAVAPQVPGCVWSCYNVVLPFGLYVRTVSDGGSFVTLEDGSVWEIRLPQRPVASSWRPGDFVQLKTIAAPVDRFEILLAHGDYDKAEARLAGRDRPPAPEPAQE
jgi:hypothetical protein